MATPEQTRRRGRLGFVVGTVLAVLMLTAVAYADTVANNLDTTIDATAETMNLTVGGAPQTTVIYVQPVTGGDGETGCNLKNDASLKVNVSSLNPARATVSPSQVTLDDCGQSNGKTITVTPVSAGSATITFSQAAFTGSNPQGTFVYNTATFTANVAAPADGTAPTGSVSIDGNAAYTNSTSVDLGLAATDGVGVTAYRVANGSDCSSAPWQAVSSTTSFSQTVAHTLTAGDGNKAVCAQYKDAQGNISSTATDSIVLDTIAPTIQDAGVQSGTAGANGWYVSAVVNRFTATDGGGSGLSAACSASFPEDVSTGSNEGTGVTVSSGACSDLAGNTNPGISSGAFKIDLTDPSALLTASGTLGTNGWYTSNVTVSTNGADPVSGPVSCTAEQSQTTETAGQVFNGSCTNQAGLSTNAAPLMVKLDKTAPSAALSVTAGTLGANGWYTSDVTVATNGTDSISNPVSCTGDRSQSDETTGEVFTGSCTNDAGLSTDAAPLTVKLDKSGPSAVLAVTAGQAGANGWYTSNVTVDTSGTDTISGPVTCTPNQSQTSDTAGQLFNGSCTNDAGLTTNAVPLTVKLDKTAPSATLTATGTLGSNGWFIDNVAVDTSGADTISGPVTCTPSQSQTTETTGHVFNGSCTNQAGLIGNAAPVTVKLDKTNPSVAITSPVGGSTTIASSVTVSGTDSDSTSGIASVKVNGSGATLGSGTFSKSGVALACGSNTITVLATDNAGRTSTDSITVTRQCFGLQFLQPLDQSTSAPIMNKGKYGRVIPVKVLLSLAGGATLDGAALAANGWTLQIGVNGASCQSGAAADDIEAYADAGQSAGGSNLFRWDDGQWIHNLDTKSPPGMTMTIGSCYRLDVYVSDGTNKVVVSTSAYAVFQPTK